ncbi:MAG: hypothetical protein P4L16_07775 [Chlamydiales bacterium]|nr:hypothetical protein [Chlamydiales bacterium]
MPSFSLLPKTVELQLKQEIENFFSHAVDVYLDDLVQKGLKRTHPSEERNVQVLINNFIKNVETSDFSAQTLGEEIAFINKWKRDFTKKVLIPKYLANRLNISLDQLTLYIQKSILGAAIKRKVQYYIQTCQSKLIRDLQIINPAKRIPAAKYLINSSLKQFQAEDAVFPKELFLNAFDPEHLEILLSHIPFRSDPSSTYEDELFLKQIEKQLISYIQNRLSNEKKEAFQLTKQLHIVNQFLVTFEKNEQALSLWGFTNISLTPSLKKHLFLAILKCKALVFLTSYLKEVSEAKKTTSFEAFSKAREAILKKYLTHYIHNHNSHLKFVREHFLICLKEEEKESRKIPFQNNDSNDYKALASQKPKRSKRWKRV